jgi:hypothetical protein
MGFSHVDNDKSMLQICLEHTDYTPFAYSGRGMNDRQCVGVDIGAHTIGQFLNQLLTAGEEFNDETFVLLDLAEEITSMKTDSLGKGTVVYFREIPFIHPQEDEESDNGEFDDGLGVNTDIEPINVVGHLSIDERVALYKACAEAEEISGGDDNGS